MAAPAPQGAFGGVLQPGKGRIPGQHYLSSATDDVLSGYVPTVHATPVTSIGSGESITIDSLSHEGILEDQGRDPVGFFAGHGVKRGEVLAEAIDLAANYDRTVRNFDVDGPMSSPDRSPSPGHSRVTYSRSRRSTCNCGSRTASSPAATARRSGHDRIRCASGDHP